MITELIGIGACLYVIDKFYDAERREIKRIWKRIMEENNLKNEKGGTYNIAKINPAEYGFLIIIGIPYGYSFKELEEKKAVIESNLKGVVELEHNLYNGWITMRLIRKPLDDTKYEPIKTKPHELYLGYTYYKHIIADMNKFPHLLIAGINNSGKTRGLYVILTTLLHNHNENEIEVYASQIGKTDLLVFRSCPQVKRFTRNPEDSLRMYQYLNNELKHREEIIENEMPKGVLNIEDYNKRYTEKMKYIYIVSDEFSLYMPDKTDSKAEKEFKEQCLDILMKIVKLGRAYGMFLIMSLQKTTNDQMPQLLKSQVNTKICFKQTDVYSSRNIIDNDDALNLQQREAILLLDDRYRIKTPYIDDMLMKKYLPTNKTTGQKKTVIELSATLKQNSQDGVIKC